MAASVEGKISITIRDVEMFGDLNGLQKFIKEQLEPKVLEAASQVYTQTGQRAGSTFNLQPVNTRCVSDIGAPTGIRGVEVSVTLSGKFG